MTPPRKSKPRARKKRSVFRFLWITDPWSTLDHPKDTTLRLAEEALAQGAESHWCDLRTLRWENGRTLAEVRQILQIYPGRVEKAFKLSEPRTISPGEFDSIHYRTDPPVDLAYLHPLQLLLLDADAARKLVNPGPVLCLGNEKLEASALGPLLPPTIAATQWDALQAFGRAEGQTVLKPLHQAQSKGIELLDWNSDAGRADSKQKIAAATDNYTRPVLLQRYLPGIADGEQRLWFVDGALHAVVRKLPMPKDFRVDMDRGSRLAPSTLAPVEKKAATRIAAHLKARKIRLAAVDLIDGYVTDFNFTSPGLIPQMEGTLGRNLASGIIRALMRSARK